MNSGRLSRDRSKEIKMLILYIFRYLLLLGIGDVPYIEIKYARCI